MHFISSLAAFGFSLSQTLAIPTTPKADASPLTKRDGLCDGSGPFAANDMVGSPGEGVAFCETGWNTRPYPVTTISVWGMPGGSVRGLQLSYLDGYQSQVYGTSDGIPVSSITLDLKSGETITQAILSGYVNGEGNYLRGMTLSTSAGQTLAAATQPGDGTEIPYHDENVAAGLLYGVQGRYTDGGVINQLELLFLRSSIGSIEVENIVFPKGPTGTEGIVPDQLDSLHSYNDGSSPENWMIQGQRQFQVVTTFTQATTNTMTTTSTVTFSGSIPTIFTAMAADMFQWANMQSTTDMTATTKSTTITWTQSGTNQPGQGVTCNALAGTGSGTFPYTSTVLITLDDGFQYQYPESGSFYINSVSTASVVCQEDDSPPA